MKKRINSWLYGPGIVLRSWHSQDGQRCYLAAFPGWGRQLIRASQFDAQAWPFSDN